LAFDSPERGNVPPLINGSAAAERSHTLSASGQTRQIERVRAESAPDPIAPELAAQQQQFPASARSRATPTAIGYEAA